MFKALSPRLALALSYVDLTRPVWDIGCDHGALGVTALLKGAPRVHFVDRVPNIIATLPQRIPHGLAPERFQCHCADASMLSAAVTGTLVLCGMGGRRIIEIVTHLDAQRDDDALRVVFEAQPAQADVKAHLLALGYTLRQSRTVTERKRVREVTMMERVPT